MEKKRNITYDYLKGIAMLSIVIGHLYFYSGRHVGSIIFSICDTIELPVFLYISGLLAHVSVDRYGFRKLIASKVIRLLFPLFSFYLIWSLWDTSNFLTFWLKEFKNGYWFMLVLFELMVTLSSIKQFSIRFNIKTIYVTIVVYALATLVFFLLPKDGDAEVSAIRTNPITFPLSKDSSGTLMNIKSTGKRPGKILRNNREN